MQVEVTAHNPRWKDDFEKEAQKLMSIYDGLLLEIYHIGSTSVTGLKAKPVIDIMPIVSDINEVDKFDGQMQALGYEPLGENGIVGRRFFENVMCLQVKGHIMCISLIQVVKVKSLDT